MAKISLGDTAIVSQGSFLCAGTHDVSDPDFQLLTRPISIGDRAWVAADAFIGPGVNIGTGTVIGARAVVTRDAKAWTIYAGNPAKEIRKRELRERQ